MKKGKILLALCVGLLLAAGPVCAQPEKAPQFEKYIVKDGETPAMIADKFHIKKKDFLMLNDFPSYVVLKPGQEVLVKQLKEGEKPVEDATAGGQYAANNGPALANEAKEEKEDKPKPTSHPATPTHAAPGKKISEPGETKSTYSPPPPKPSASASPAKGVQTGPGGIKYAVSDDGYHIVEKGQTFYRIALIYGLTVDQLKKLNNMTNTEISVGQKLRVK